MNHPRLYHTLRLRFEASEKFISKGKTAEASDLNQLTITETLIEILATLDEIAGTLYILASAKIDLPGSTPPVEGSSNPKSSIGNHKSGNPKPVPPKVGS